MKRCARFHSRQESKVILTWYFAVLCNYPIDFDDEVEKRTCHNSRLSLSCCVGYIKHEQNDIFSFMCC